MVMYMPKYFDGENWIELVSKPVEYVEAQKILAIAKKDKDKKGIPDKYWYSFRVDV